MQIEELEWDEGYWPKCGKHGVSKEEIKEMLLGDHYIVDDEAHSVAEARFQAIGHNSKGRLIYVVFTIRSHKGALIIRPISARFMHQKEISRHERDQEKA